MGGGRAAPVSGGVLRGYDTAHVYWAALSCYKPHAALDLAAQAGETVLCAMDGVVERASRDDLWGWRVTVAQTDGRRAVYAGLLLCRVQAGQCVTRGQALGRSWTPSPARRSWGRICIWSLIMTGRRRTPRSCCRKGDDGKNRENDGENIEAVPE